MTSVPPIEKLLYRGFVLEISHRDGRWLGHIRASRWTEGLFDGIDPSMDFWAEDEEALKRKLHEAVDEIRHMRAMSAENEITRFLARLRPDLFDGTPGRRRLARFCASVLFGVSLATVYMLVIWQFHVPWEP